MANLLDKEDIFKTIARLVADAVFEYYPEKDVCFIYTIEKEGLCMFREVPEWRKSLYSATHGQSHRVLDEMFHDIDILLPNGEYEFQLRNGLHGDVWSWVHCVQTYNSEEQYYMAFVSRIDERVKENLRLFEEAKMDSLTKLYNKAFSAEAIAESIEKNQKGVLYIIDVDNFKAVNDTMGHMFGDEVIVNVANAIRSVFREKDIVGRIGGDEFIAYVDNLTDKDLIRRKAEQICKSVAKIYTGEHENVKISASIGIALVPEHAVTYEALFPMADQALYYTKRKGKNAYYYYDPHNKIMHEHSQGVPKRKEILSDKEEKDEEMDGFYTELNELAFRMLQETKDEDSAIHLLLHKIKNKLKLSAIRILEEKGNMYELSCTHELFQKDMKSVLGKTYHYNEAQWTMLNGLCNQEPFIYYQSQSENMPSVFKIRDTIKAGIIIPIQRNSAFSGVIIFEDCQKEHAFTVKEQKIMKSFERIFAVYTTKKMTKNQHDYYIRQFAERDSVTGALVYAAFLKKLEEVVYDIPENNKMVYIQADIVRFKYVNDSYGYDIGNKLIGTMLRCLGVEQDNLLAAGRIHSDNVIMVFKIPNKYSDKQIIDFLNKRLESTNEKLNEMVKSTNIGINCGLYITKGTDYHYNNAISYAEYAKKIAKERNDSRCVCFDEEMKATHKRQLWLIESFESDLQNNKIDVYYQPQIDAVSRTVVGAEALTRWKMPDGSVIVPNEYVSVLEGADKLWKLEYFVIENVVAFIKKQQEVHDVIIPVSINLSKRHMKDMRFLAYLEQLSEKYNVSLENILFEIKEEVFINYMEETIDFCRKLSDIGVRVMMDCFGAGYSSLNVLDKLPVAYIKIDRMFIRNRKFEKNEELILKGIIDIIARLKRYTISIGVETVEQTDFLRRCGCDIIQGNYFSEPLLEEEFLTYAKEHAEAEYQEAIFSFDGTLQANKPEYRASINGVYVGYNAESVPGREVLDMPGGTTAREILELELPSMFNGDFTISVWYHEREKKVWTSLFYVDFENAFLSLIPNGWDGVSSLFRVMDKVEEMKFFDVTAIEEPVNGWMHMAAVYNKKNNMTALFLNGSLMGCKNDVMKMGNPGRIILGGDVYQSSFNGMVSDLRVVNKAMSAKDILQLYEESKSIYQGK